MRHAPAVLLVPAILAAFTLASVPSVARADVATIVLGLTSVEGDDEYARNLTGAIRNEASRVPGWQVSEREVTLAQMSLAHGCGDVPDVDCLRQIATTLNAVRLLYGTIRREGGDFHVTLSLFDSESGQIERSVEETLSGRRTDIDDLREPARAVVAQISGPITGSLRIASNTPGATVSIDGSVAGSTDTGGEFAMPAIPIGEHSVEVSADGMEPWTGRVTISRGTEMTLDAELVERVERDGGGGGAINWTGIALIGAGALSFGVTIYSWARIEAIESDSQYNAYRTGWPAPPPRDVCASAEAGVMNGGANPRTVADLCSEASTLEVLQYVFLGVAVAAVGTGAVFLATGIGAEGGESEGPSVSLLPSFGPDGGRLTARVRF